MLRDALADPGKTVRYYAALQMSGLDAEMGRLAVPVLQQILAQEKDPDLVDRAKLGLMRADPAALAVRPPAPRAGAPPAPRRGQGRGGPPRAHPHHREGRDQAQGLDQPAARRWRR